MEPRASDNPSLAADAVQDSPPAERPAGKFMYPGGTRPLDGYTIKRGVGQGGFGEIYYALSDAGKEVALKLIRRNLDVELRGIRQCLNLKHPNLLTLFDIRQDDVGDTWVIMEFVAGTSLQEALEANPRGLPVPEALAWIHGLGAAVAYLHDHGIVHRDLKPGNVFSDEGVVKVGDYGLSKFISCSRRSGHTESIGTVHYMAPEVASGRYGKQLDVYAMGVILYEMLTGRVPFEGESVGEILMKHLTARPDVSMLPEPYKTVVARALDKDPEKRYPSAAEMLTALPPPAALPGMNRLPSGGRREEKSEGAAGPEAGIWTEATDEEPVLRLLRGKIHELRTWWRQSRLNTPARIGLIVLAALVLLHSAPVVISLALTACFVYGIYWVIWSLVHTGSRSQTAPPVSGSTPTTYAPPEAAPAPQPAPTVLRSPVENHRPWRRHHEQPLSALVLGPPRQRAADLLGSLLLSTLAAAAMTVVLFLLSGSSRSQPLEIEQLAWLFLAAVAGSWTVLIPAKLWEGTLGDQTLRRFMMMILGLGLGVLACGLASHLLVNLPDNPKFHLWQPGLAARGFFGEDGRPLWQDYVAAFGTLFLLVRWWRQADPLRSTRLSLKALIVTVVLAFLAADAWDFPQPWLPMLAAAISVSVQLASPWLGHHRRMHPRL
ncbi:MAG: serine/threonine protein kinase [Pirellulales bacterium]|nr:serine/threonine protein kinase [Pirellulales bacterium]